MGVFQSIIPALWQASLSPHSLGSLCHSKMIVIRLEILVLSIYSGSL
jgi:hypothetical protein